VKTKVSRYSAASRNAGLARAAARNERRRRTSFWQFFKPDPESVVPRVAEQSCIEVSSR
jgi:hypothetical protein